MKTCLLLLEVFVLGCGVVAWVFGVFGWLTLHALSHHVARWTRG